MWGALLIEKLAGQSNLAGRIEMMMDLTWMFWIPPRKMC